MAYETVEFPDGSLPLLAPMSEVAGRMAPQVGATSWSGRTGAGGSCWAECRVSAPPRSWSSVRACPGMNAAWIAQGMEAEVVVLDKNINKLRDIDRIHQGKILTLDVEPAGGRGDRARGGPGHRRRAGPGGAWLPGS